MKRNYLILLVLAILVFSGCAQPMPTPPAPAPAPAPAPPPAPAPTPTPTPAPTPTPTPTEPTQPIPEEILASHFGIDGAVQDMDGISKLGIRWNRSPLPFVWGLIEPERGEYTWRRRVDGYVEKNQAYNFAILAIIWPFAEWDQANWGPAPADTDPILDEEFLGRSRRKPYDMDAYRRFVSALVERYDGDGIDDMPGLKYPIKYWEVMNEPSTKTGYYTTFRGSSEDYLEILKATYEAVKEADPEAKVLHAGMVPREAMVSSFSFWAPIFEKGSQYFDIANIHAVRIRAELVVPELRKFMSKYGIDKPIWVTEAEYFVTRYASPEEHGQAFVKSYVVSFACGVDKFFYTSFTALHFVLKHQAVHYIKDSCLIDENGEKRPAYYGFKTLIEKLDKFTSAEKLAEGQYEFMVEGKAIYVLWGAGEIPEEITGEVLVTDIYGKETRTDSSAIKLTDSPIFVEST